MPSFTSRSSENPDHLTKLLASPTPQLYHINAQNLEFTCPCNWAAWKKSPLPQHGQRKFLVTSLGATEAALVQAEKFTAWEIKLERRKVNEDWLQQNFCTCNSSDHSWAHLWHWCFPLQDETCFLLWCFSLWDCLRGQVWEQQGPRTSWDVFLPLHPQNCFLMGSSRWKCLWAQGSFVPWKKEQIYLQEPLIIDWKHKVDEMFSEGWFTM